MGKLVLFFLILSASSAWAFPGVGDRVEWFASATFANEGKLVSVAFLQSNEVLGFDSTAQMYTLEQSLDLPNGEQQTEQKQVALAEMVSSQAIEQILASCVEQGGSLETIEVLAGKFDTCALAQDGGSKVWLGRIPFGIVKQIIPANGENPAITLEAMLVLEGASR